MSNLHLLLYCHTICYHYYYLIYCTIYLIVISNLLFCLEKALSMVVPKSTSPSDKKADKINKVVLKVLVPANVAGKLD